MEKSEKKKKNEKMKKLKNNEKNEAIWLHTQNPQRFPGFSFGMCLFPEENQQPVLGGDRDNFHWTWNNNAHFSYENRRKKSLRSARLTIIILLE